MTDNAMQLRGNTALLVIDVQLGFDDPEWGPRNNAGAERNVARLLLAWRQAAMPVTHVHHDSRSPDDAFWPGKTGNQAKAETAPIVGENVIRKTVNSAFIGTELEADLRRRNIDALVVVGLTTNHCVSTTARMAGNLGFQTFVVSDATATFARSAADGRMRGADEVHQAALGDLAGEFATIVGTDDVLAAFARIGAEASVPSA